MKYENLKRIKTEMKNAKKKIQVNYSHLAIFLFVFLIFRLEREREREGRGREREKRERSGSQRRLIFLNYFESRGLPFLKLFWISVSLGGFSYGINVNNSILCWMIVQKSTKPKMEISYIDCHSNSFSENLFFHICFTFVWIVPGESFQ